MPSPLLGIMASSVGGRLVPSVQRGVAQANPLSAEPSCSDFDAVEEKGFRGTPISKTLSSRVFMPIPEGPNFGPQSWRERERDRERERETERERERESERQRERENYTKRGKVL